MITKPEIYEFKWEKDKHPFIVLGSNGIWDSRDSMKINLGIVNEGLK